MPYLRIFSHTRWTSREGDTWSASSNFDVNVTPRPRAYRLFDFFAHVWKPLSSTLSDPGWGVSFSLARGGRHSSRAILYCRATYAGYPDSDLATFRRLFEVRKEDLAKKLALITKNSLARQEHQNQSTVVANSNKVAA